MGFQALIGISGSIDVYHRTCLTSWRRATITESVGNRKTETDVSGQSTRKRHLIYIDNLRTTLITFVIILHVAITYGADGLWYCNESGETDTVMIVVMIFLAAIGSAFVLGLFFMLAGYFTPRSYDKKGFSGFLADRAKRLLIPLAIYEIFIFPLIRFGVRSKEGYQGSPLDYLSEHFRGLETIADGPVWFLLALMLFIFLYALCRLEKKQE